MLHRRSSTRAIAGVTLGFVAALTTVALARPGDPFNSALPGRDTAAPEGISNAAASADVSLQHGAASYAFAISVPPGRGGMEPSLALRYSSSGALRGGLAAGWTLSGSSIERDTQLPDAYRLDGDLLVSSPGDLGTGTVYRRRIDRGDLTRIERIATSWIVRTPDGITRTYAGDGASRWNLTTEKDSFGNTVTYNWTAVAWQGHVDFVLSSIDYGGNSSAGLHDHARVELTWTMDTCSTADWVATMPTGARYDHHFGRYRMYGSERLTRIKTSVRDTPGGALRDVRQYDVKYDTAELACGTGRPALRYLTEIDEIGNPGGAPPLAAPPVTFSYGPKQRELGYTIQTSTPDLGERGTDRGPDAQLMDFDGDGINDQVRVAMPPAMTSGGCRFFWRKGAGGGLFLGEVESWLPRTTWGGTDGRPLSAFDACTVNGQFATRPRFTSGKGHCIESAAEIGYRFLDWDHDGDLDLVANTIRTGGAEFGGDFANSFPLETEETEQGGCPDGTTETGIDSAGTSHCACPDGAHPNGTGTGCDNNCSGGSSWNPETGGCGAACTEFFGCSNDPWDPQDMADPSLPDAAPGLSACDQTIQLGVGFHVFFNDGGFHPLDHRYVGTDAPLPPSGGVLQPGYTPPAAAKLPTLIDIDGDGALDQITLDDYPYIDGAGEHTLSAADHLNVHRGKADGTGFLPREQWPFPTWAANVVTDTAEWSAEGTKTYLKQAGQLLDVDGDGLLDLVVQMKLVGESGVPMLYVAFNLDGRFGNFVSLGLRSSVGQQIVEMSPGRLALASFNQGYRGEQKVTSDIDGDGRVELVTLVTSATGGVSAPALQRSSANLGESGANTGLIAPSWEALERLVVSVNSNAWYRASDMIDMTGDGRPDSVTFPQSGFATIKTDAPGSDPERLLVSINNGRGGITRFAYGTSTDASVVARGSSMRNDPRWVVRSKTVSSTVPAPWVAPPDMTTSYAYADPVYRKELPSDVEPRFVGFAQTTIDRSGQQAATSLRTVTDYAYTLDPGGYIVEQWTYIRPGRSYVPVRNEVSSWSVVPLGNGASQFLRRDVHTTRVCDVNASEAACEAEAENVLVESQAWAPLTGVAGPALYLNWQSTSEHPSSSGLVQRVTVRGHQVRIGQPEYANGDYRILTTSEERRASTSGAALSKTTTTYDVKGLPTDTYVYTTANVADAAHTVRTFDATTGNVITVKRPNQVATGAAKVTSFAYDAHKIFVAQTTNELGHVVKETHDAGTGGLTRREGPNKRSWVPVCKAPPCPGMQTQLAPELWTLDAFGRVVEHKVAVDPAAGDGYATATVETIAYNDTVTPGTRTSNVLRDFGASTWITSVDTFDGLGRVLRHRVNGPPVTDTTYTYDAGGALRSITSPDPRNDLATVTTTYDRDGLGRVTKLTRADGTHQYVAYQGLSQQIQDSGPEGLGPITRVDNDPAGRMVAVHEPEGTDGSLDHVTAYAYNVMDRLTAIVDADFNVTTVEHDLAGRRTGITRGARTWSYIYDADGNLRFQQAPVPAAGLAADYRSETTYDDLGRQKAHIPATRGMDATRRAALGIGPITTLYDFTNAVGLPGRIDLPFGRIEYQYNVRSQVKRETRTLALGHGMPATLTQWVDRTYNAIGMPVDAAFDDGTRWTTNYDTRAMVAGVVWHGPGGDMTLASYARSLAGPPRKRTSSAGPQREWTYDTAGRVMRDRIFKTSGPTWVDRSYGYDSFGRLGATTGVVNGQDAGADYDYDARGRLAVANVGVYQASMVYTPGGNIKHAAVHGALDVPNRDVEYRYGAVDPQAVDRLESADGSAWATLSYDRSGNLVGRIVPGGIETLTPDGDDQIREVSGANGTEVYYFGPNAERIASFGPNGTKVWFGESESHYVGAAATLRWFHIGAGEPVARIERIGGGAPTAELQFADTLQNLTLTLATNATNTVTSSFLYGGFGEVVWQSGASNHRRQFNGKEADVVSGLRHYGFRSYDPVLLRWTAGDPLFRFAPDAAWAEPQRANLYGFSLNNPVRYYDPDGRDSEEQATTVEEGAAEEPTPACESGFSCTLPDGSNYYFNAEHAGPRKATWYVGNGRSVTVSEEFPAEYKNWEETMTGQNAVPNAGFYPYAGLDISADIDPDGEVNVGVEGAAGALHHGTAPVAAFGGELKLGVSSSHGLRANAEVFIVKADPTIIALDHYDVKLDLGVGLASPIGWDNGPKLRGPTPILFGLSLTADVPIAAVPLLP